MSAGDPDAEIGPLDVLDAAGERIGAVEGQTRAELARHLLVALDDDAQESLDSDGTLDLPAAMIQRLGSDEIELNRSLADIKEWMDEVELEDP